MSDCHEFIEVSTEHIYALNIDNINGNSVITLDSCLECLPRALLVDNNTVHEPFVRVYLGSLPSHYFEALCAPRPDLGRLTESYHL